MIDTAAPSSGEKTGIGGASSPKSGMADSWIIKNIGMDKDELLRLKQITGLAELFAGKEFGMSKEWVED